MKKKKLTLKKEIIANLSNNEMTNLVGGIKIHQSGPNELCENVTEGADTVNDGSICGGGGSGGGGPYSSVFSDCSDPNKTYVGNCQFSVENCVSPSVGFGCVSPTMGCTSYTSEC